MSGQAWRRLHVLRPFLGYTHRLYLPQNSRHSREGTQQQFARNLEPGCLSHGVPDPKPCIDALVAGNGIVALPADMCFVPFSAAQRTPNIPGSPCQRHVSFPGCPGPPAISVPLQPEAVLRQKPSGIFLLTMDERQASSGYYFTEGKGLRSKGPHPQGTLCFPNIHHRLALG